MKEQTESNLEPWFPNVISTILSPLPCGFPGGLQRGRLKGSNTAHNCKLTIQKGMELRYGFDTNISSPSPHQRA